MANSGNLKVSSRGQISLPSAVQRRWDLQDGGDLAYVDLGGAVVLVPGDVAGLRRQLLDSLTAEDWATTRTGFGDPDLASE